MTSSIPTTDTRDRWVAAKKIVRIASGNMLEMYDFMIFGFYAKAIGAAFFPSGDATAQLLSALATFGAGFMMRPLGAILLGSFIDRHGRRAGLLVTLGLMAIGTLTIALTPSYATIGTFAPVLIVIGRLIQGFSAGAELGGVSVYLAKIAPPGRRGFYTSFQSGSLQLAVMGAALLGFVLNSLFDHLQMASWGWRIPFVLGCLVIPMILVLRSGMEETEAFEHSTERPSLGQALSILMRNAAPVLRGMMLVVMTTVSFYTVTSYTPTFGTHELHLTMTASLLVTLAVGLCNFAVLPLGGLLSDRVGRRPVLIGAGIAMAVVAYPAMAWLTTTPSVPRFLAVELGLAVIYAIYNGALVPYLSESMPENLRVTGFSLAYSLATAFFGGLTPFICTALIARTGNAAMPGLWLTVAALIALLSVLISPRTTRPGVVAGQARPGNGAATI